MEQWLAWFAGVIVAVIFIVTVSHYRANRWYDKWVLQHGDFLLFEQAEFDSYWSGRRDTRNRTIGNNYVFYHVNFTYHDGDTQHMYFRAPLAFEKTSSAEKRILFTLHYRRIFDVMPEDIGMVFDCYM